MMMKGNEPGETFSQTQVMMSIKQFLEYGEDTCFEEMGHRGYYSGHGWAARCLRFHLRKLEAMKADG